MGIAIYTDTPTSHPGMSDMWIERQLQRRMANSSRRHDILTEDSS